MMHPYPSAGLRRQRGVALALSLVMLVAMTLLGVATLSGTRVNEQVTGNAQQRTIAFEAAESAIYSVWQVNDLLASATQIPAENFNEPGPVTPGNVTTLLEEGLDQTNGGETSVDIEATVTIQYCGESSLPEGSSLSADESGTQMVGLLIDVNGKAEIENTNTRADHLQRGSIVRPGTGRKGKCAARGLLVVAAS